MSPVIGIILSALLTGVTCVACGLLLLQALRVRLTRQERLPLAFITGSAILSGATFVLCASWLARPWAFGLVSAAALAAAVWQRSWRIEPEPDVATLSAVWRWVFRAGITAFGFYTFVWALAPETSPDGTAYHLGTVARWLRLHGFDWYTTNMYANMPMGVEMLFMHAFAFGRHSAAALVHWQFMIAVPFLLRAFGMRFGFPAGGVIGGLLFFMSPVVEIDGASAYVDVATAAAVFACVYALLIYEQQRYKGWLVVIGVLAGWSYACKMTGYLAVPFAMAFVAVVHWRAKERIVRPVLTVALFAACVVVPWMAKSAMTVGNPLSPFYNRWFPNPYVRISFENEYREGLRTYFGAVKDPRELPLEVTVRGRLLNGLLGPVFLLTPVALIAIRWPAGRRLIVAAILFAVHYPSNIGTRFLLTSLPFVSLALGMVLSQWKGAALPVVLFHALFSWPPMIPFYSDQYSWRIEHLRWKQALRIESEEAYLNRWVPGYPMARLVEKEVPPQGRVLTYGSVAEAYTSREVLVAYQAGFNNMAGDVLATGLSGDFRPDRTWEFRFRPREVRKLRLVQTKSVPEMWSVSEFRVYETGGAEITRAQSWRLRCEPNPWHVQRAFDNCPVSRWRGWEPAQSGQMMELDFGRPHEIEAVRIEVSPDQRTSARIDLETAPGRWETVAAEPKIVPHEPIPEPRLAAKDDLKRLGITHLAIGKEDFIAPDMQQNLHLWGMTLIGETPQSRLYRLN